MKDSFDLFLFEDKNKCFNELKKEIDQIKKDQKLIVIPGGKTPLAFYRDYLNDDSCDYLLSDERISNDLRKRNELTIQEVAPNIKFEYSLLNFNYKNIHQTDLLTDFLEKRGKPDAVILGMGDDGHYASIFDNSDILFQCKKNFYKVVKLSDNSDSLIRLSLTSEYMQNADKVIFLISGEKKIRLIQDISGLKNNFSKLPIYQFLSTTKNKIKFFAFN